MTSRKGFVYDTTSRANPGNVSPEASDYPNVIDVGVLEDGTFNDSVTSLDSDETYYYRAFGYDDVEDLYVYGDEVSFSTPPIGEITTEPATNINFSSVTLNGDVTELNSPNLVGSFKYSVVGSGVWQETDVELIGITGPFSQNVTGLLSNTDYQFMFVATHETEEIAGDIEYFTTPPIGEITTEPATNTNFSSVTLNGDVDVINSPNLVGSFKYSVVGSGVWQETDVELIGITGPFSQNVTGLISETDYQFMFVATHETEEIAGDIEYFTTLVHEKTVFLKSLRTPSGKLKTPAIQIKFN